MVAAPMANAVSAGPDPAVVVTRPGSPPRLARPPPGALASVRA